MNKIHIRYDIKGSLYKRFTNDKYFYIIFSDHTIALKDLNLIENGFKMKLKPQIAEQILKNLKKDCQFFEDNNIIDYSLLLGKLNLVLGVHYIDKDSEELHSSKIF